MKKVVRSRKGFTLVEIILVVAIIVILAGAAAVGVVAKINRANQNAEAVRLHAAGGYFWTVEGGKVVELDPNDYDPNNPYHRSGGAMDMQYDEVKYIQGVAPTIAPQTYNPGGSGGLNPGTGGSGGDNPGDNPGGGGTPELWNGHTEEWWNENDAKWEEKIQQLKDQGIPPENIHVTKDERGHITGVTWSNPNSGGSSSSSSGSGSSSSGSSGSGSSGSESGSGSTGSVTSNGMSFSTGAGGGTRGIIDYSTNGNTTTFKVTDLQGQQNLEMTITKNGNNYVLDMGSAKWNINYQFPGYDYNTNASVYTLNTEQKTWLTNTYGITFN